MKRRFLSLIATVLFGCIGKAQEKTEFKSGSIVTSFNKEVIEYKFKSIDDLDQEIERIGKELKFDSSENKKESCELIMEIKLEVTLGDSMVLLSEKIITNCLDESRIIVIKKLKAMIIAVAVE
jgi:hypothetical protein